MNGPAEEFSPVATWSDSSRDHPFVRARHPKRKPRRETSIEEGGSVSGGERGRRIRNATRTLIHRLIEISIRGSMHFTPFLEELCNRFRSIRTNFLFKEFYWLFFVFVEYNDR